MICLECGCTIVDFWINNQIIIKEHESEGITGLHLKNIFNRLDQTDYKITCNNCGETLKEVNEKIRREKTWSLQKNAELKKRIIEEIKNGT